MNASCAALDHLGRQRPVLAARAEVVDDAPRAARRVTPVPASLSASSLRARCWNSAPIAATPKVPPTMRLIERMPEPTPAFSGATEFIAAVDIGDITSAMPMPITTNAGSSRP